MKRGWVIVSGALGLCGLLWLCFAEHVEEVTDPPTKQSDATADLDLREAQLVGRGPASIQNHEPSPEESDVSPRGAASIPVGASVPAETRRILILDSDDRAVESGEFRMRCLHPDGSRVWTRGKVREGAIDVLPSPGSTSVTIVILKLPTEFLEPTIRCGSPGSLPSEIRLRRGRSITGRVVSDSGTPISGARVRAFALPPRGPRPSRLDQCRGHDTTDDDGAFSLHVPNELSGMVRVTLPGRTALMETRPFTIADQRMEIRIAPRRSVQGRVKSAQGGPLQGSATATIRFSHRADGEPQSLFGTLHLKIKKDGRFTIPPLFAGHPCWCEVSVMEPKDGVRSGALRIVPEEGDVQIQLQAGVYISGRAVDKRGNVVVGRTLRADALDSLDHYWATSGSRGEFRFGPLVPGPFRISDAACSGNVATRPRLVTAPSAGVTLSLHDAAERVRIEGRYSLVGLTRLLSPTVRWISANADISGSVGRSGYGLEDVPDEPGTLFLYSRWHGFAWARMDSPREPAPNLTVGKGKPIEVDVKSKAAFASPFEEAAWWNRIQRGVKVVVRGPSFTLPIFPSRTRPQSIKTPALPPGRYRVELWDRTRGLLIGAQDNVNVGSKLAFEWDGGAIGPVTKR